MVTKVINTGDSSSGILAVVAVILVLVIGYIMYSQGMFGGEKQEININLPDGKSVSGSVTQ